MRFEPYMAGERTSIEQRQGAFTGLTLASTRTQLLSAVIEGLTRASAERLPLLASRWSIDPTALDARILKQNSGIAGQLSRTKA